MSFLSELTHPIRNLVRGRPVLAIFEACLRCNSQCGYCDLPLNQGREELSRQEIQRIFTKLYHDDGIRYLFIQGGEPLLRKDLLDILGDLAKIGFNLGLVTNGTLLKPAFVNKLATLPISISVSLDTLNRERYRSIRGADQLPQVLEGFTHLENFLHAKYVTCIVSEKNRADVLDVVHFARSRGFIPVVGAYHWGIERYGKVDLTLQYERSAAIHVFNQVHDSGMVPRGYFQQYLHDNIQWLEGKSLAPCDAGRYSISIDASGNVAPCYALQPAGNLRDSSLGDILARMDRGAIKQCSDKSSCNLLCSRIVGSTFRHPISALLTPTTLPPTNTREASALDSSIPPASS